MAMGLFSFLRRSKPEPPAFSRETHREAVHSKRRDGLKAYLRPGTTGAEIGVFWAHFSEVLIEDFEVGFVHLVDPWDLAYGEKFPSWNAYTNHGELTTAEAMGAALALQEAHPGRVKVHKTYSLDFFSSLPDESLDWAYIDAAHAYEKVRADLRACLPKIKPDGVIAGDDFFPEQSGIHPGVRQAVTEFAAEKGLELVLQQPFQYILLRPDSPRPQI